MNVDKSKDNKVKVVLDTNFLMIPGQFKVDIFEEIKKLMDHPYELCIFKETIDELNKIASTNNKHKTAAKIALKLIKQKNLKSLENSFKKGEIYIDDIILNSVDEHMIVCTQDRELKKTLKAKFNKIRIISLKSQKYLGFA